VTAPAAAPASGPIAALAPRAAPQSATDRFAFAAVLDSLPGAAAKAGASIAACGSRTPSEPRQGEPPSAQPDGHSTLSDGAFLSVLPFAALSPSAPIGRAGAAPDSSSLAPASMQGARLAIAAGSNATTPDPLKPAAARLIGERAFHFALSTSRGVGPAIGGEVQTDAPSFAPAPPAGESGALGSSAPPPPSTAAARQAGASADQTANPIRASAQGPASGGRKSEAAAPSSSARATSPAAPSAKPEPRDKTTDGRPPDPVASTGQSTPQGEAFGAQPPLTAAVPSVGSYDAPARVGDVAPHASAAAVPQASAAPPLREIDVDLSPSGLEDVSMTMRLAGDRLSVVIRAASSQTAGSIEGARDAIADRLAAIGQPLDSLIVRQTGVSDGNANGNAASADEGSTGGGRQSDKARAMKAARAMRVPLGAALLAIAASSAAPSRAEGPLACEREMTRAAALNGVPINVLYSVGLTETGRRGELSPYDMNIDGRDVHSATLAEAMASFARAKLEGAKLIDIGCMQINEHWHGADFTSLSEMFDPIRNVEYAARFLKTLRAEEGSWTLAVARYNAGPNNPAAERTYVCTVIRNMIASGFGRWTANASALCR
jgi:soluble lytic murein transglycosylase-like protein